ncbi:MAG: ATP-binding protein [Bacteroidales bacterium]
MEIAVISGKGGTGKSCISAAFATLSEQVVLADCDVDAANMFILFNPVHEEEQVYIGGQKAIINELLCTNCGLCIEYCRFDAISLRNDKVIIDEIFCDGCKLCPRICPEEAITMLAQDKSRLYSGSFRMGKMVYGRLAPGEENSGKLVNLVRDKAKQLSKLHHLNTIIIDGPPGIGCPVISTITGVSHVVIVTEPSVSGFLDLKRTLEITTKFNHTSWVIINKYTLNPELSNQIKEYCAGNGIPVAGEFPFDSKVVEAMVHCKSITEWAPDSEIVEKIKQAYYLIQNE